jgi:predicted  nucleic acid-binding Zn-ribbon protein
VRRSSSSRPSEASRSQRATDGVEACLQAEPRSQNPLDEFSRETSSTESASLSSPDDPASGAGSTRPLISEIHQTSRHVPALAIRDMSVTLKADSTDLENLRTLLRQTELALDRSNSDANALRLDLSQLREIAAQLGQERSRLGNACRHAEKRTETADDALNAIENRIGQLEVVRGLTISADERVASLRQLAEEVMSRAADFQAQREAIECGVVEAAQVTDRLAALEARVTKLTQKGELLRHAEEMVGHLERRAAEAAVLLEQVGRTKGELEYELANIPKKVQMLTESARNDVEMLGNHQQEGESHHLMPVSRSPTVPEPNAFAGLTSRRVQRTRQPVQLWAAGLGTLAVLVLPGIMVMRSRDQPVRRASTVRAAHPESPLSASASALPSRTLGSALFAIPANYPAGPITMMPMPRTTEPSRHAGSAEDTVQQFTGALQVQSVPTGAAVFVNQQHVGETPLQLPRMRAGSHVIRIENKGYERWTTAVLVSADKQTRVSATLQSIREH